MTSLSPARAALVLALLITIVFGAYAAVLRDGMPADATDWAMYVMHARNLLSGRPYTDTGYIAQPETAFEGAESYPSGYPLMLTPFYAAFGFNIRVFKLVSDFALALSLWPVYLFCRRSLPRPHSLLIVLATGFGFEYMGMQNTVNSDGPYQLFSFLSVVFLLWIYDRDKDASSGGWLWGALAGVAIAAAYLTRPVGLALLLAAVFVCVYRRRGIPFLLALIAAFALFALLNNFLFHKDGAYADQFTFSLVSILNNALAYLVFLSHVFANPWGNWLRYILWIPSVLLALVGLPVSIRRNSNILAEVYALILLGVLCVYHAPNPRYLMPLLPIYLVYVVVGAETVLEWVPLRYRAALRAAGAAALLLPPVLNLVFLRDANQDAFITRPPFEKLCRNIQARTGPHEYILFWNPRVLALYTNHPASAYPLEDTARVKSYFDRVQPNYIVLDKNWGNDQMYLAPVVESQPQHYVTVYENERYKLEQVSGSPDRRSNPPAPIP
jgi:hypothetical protein